jgi:hypothetical protein
MPWSFQDWLVIIDPWISAYHIHLTLARLCQCCNITSPSPSVSSLKLDSKGQCFPGRCLLNFLSCFHVRPSCLSVALTRRQIFPRDLPITIPLFVLSRKSIFIVTVLSHPFCVNIACSLVKSAWWIELVIILNVPLTPVKVGYARRSFIL